MFRLKDLQTFSGVSANEIVLSGCRGIGGAL